MTTPTTISVTRPRTTPHPRLKKREHRDPLADTLGFEARLAALRPELRLQALRLTRDDTWADDLVQDAVERALRFSSQFAPGTNLRSWVSSIVFTLFVTAYRRRRRERDARRVLAFNPCSWTQGEEQGGSRDFTPGTKRALERLPEVYRTVLLMVDVGDLNYREAGDALGIPLGTVMSRLHRARRQLATALHASSPDQVAA